MPTKNYIPIGFRPIEKAFAHAQFPIGCVHEFLTLWPEDASATNGFIAGLLSNRMQRGGPRLWVSAPRTLFPAALNRYGIAPHQIVFIDLKKERDVLYATEEAVKCNKLVAVLANSTTSVSKNPDACNGRLKKAAQPAFYSGICYSMLILLPLSPAGALRLLPVHCAMACPAWAFPDGMWSC